MAVFVNDTFTDTDGVPLENHTPGIGGSWTKRSGASDIDIQSNKALGTASTSWVGSHYTNDATPGSAEYDISVEAVRKGSNYIPVLYGRFADFSNWYRIQWNSGSLLLRKRVAGTWTTLDTYSAGAMTTDQPYNLKLEIRDNSQKGYIDSVERVSAADPTLTDAAAVGFGTDNQCTMDDFIADDIGGITGQAIISGVGSMVAVAVLTLPAIVAFSGAGSLVAAGTIGVIHEGAAVLSGVGTLTLGTPVRTLVGRSSMLGEGSLVAVGERGALAAAVLDGVGTLTVIGEVGIEGRAALAGVGSMSVLAERIVTGIVALSGVGSLDVVGSPTLVGAATLSGVGTLVAIGESGVTLYTQMGKRIYEIDPADYPSGTLFYLEATMTAEGTGVTAAVRVYNITDAGEVAGSELLIPGPGPTWDRTSAFSLPSGAKRYRLEYGGTAGGIYTPHGAALRVASS